MRAARTGALMSRVCWCDCNAVASADIDSARQLMTKPIHADATETCVFGPQARRCAGHSASHQSSAKLVREGVDLAAVERIEVVALQEVRHLSGNRWHVPSTAVSCRHQPWRLLLAIMADSVTEQHE